MFEAAEIGSAVTKKEYDARVPPLRIELLQVQRELSRQSRFPVIVVFAGVDGAGKSETVNLLNEWMDPRWVVTRAFGDSSDEEQARPEYWRYWQALPLRGRFGLFLRSWYSPTILGRVHHRIKRADFDERLNRMALFEKTLADDGAVILKFWMHLGRQAQKRHLKQLERDPLTRWRVTRQQWKHWQMYAQFVAAAERVFERTSTGYAPWTIIEGDDERYRSLTVATIVRDAVRLRLAESARVSSGSMAARREKGPATHSTVLSRLDMSREIDRSAFRGALEQHARAVDEMIARTSTRTAPWVLVEANDKYYARVKVIKALSARLKSALR